MKTRTNFFFVILLSVDFGNSNDSYDMPEDESITGMDSSVDFGNSNDLYGMPEDESIAGASSKRKSLPLQDVTNTSCDRANKVQKYATAEIVRIAPSTTSTHVHRNATTEVVPVPNPRLHPSSSHATAKIGSVPTSSATTSASSLDYLSLDYPMTLELTQYDISGNKIPGAAGKLRVQIDEPWHHPNARVPEATKASVILALTNSGLNVKALERSSAYLSWIARDLSDVLKKRLSKRVKIADYPSTVGLKGPEELAFCICSKLSSKQRSDMILIALLDIDHLIAMDEPFLRDNNNFVNRQNRRRATDHHGNLFPLYQHLNRHEKSCHSVTGNTMLPINGLGLVMDEEEFESDGSTRRQQFSHWLHQKSSGNVSFNSRMNRRVYEREKAIYERVMEDMNSAEFIQCNYDCVDRLMSTTNFSFEGLQSIIEQYGQEVLDIVEMYTDEEIPTLESLLEERQQLHAMETTTTTDVSTTTATAAPITANVAANSTASEEEMMAEVYKALSESEEKVKEKVKDSTEPNESTLTVESNEDIRLLVKRVELKYSVAKSSLPFPMVPRPPYLIFVRGDIWSRLIQIRAKFSAGTLDISTYEQVLCLFAEILETRMACIKIAKKEEQDKIAETHQSAQLCSFSLGASIQAFEDERNSHDLTDEERIDEAEDETTTFRMAAESAFKECKDESRSSERKVKGSYSTFVPLRSEMKSALRNIMFTLACIRVVKMIPFDLLLKAAPKTGVGAAANKMTRTFLDRTMEGWEKLSVADVLEHVMLYLTDDSSAEDKHVAGSIVLFISTLLHHDDFIPYYEVAEIEPMSKVAGVYTKKKDLPVVTFETKSFFGGDGDEDKQKCKRRRTKCWRAFLSPVRFNFLCPNLSPEIAFGMSCVSASSLDDSLYAFLHNEKKQMDTSKVLKEVGERGANSSKVFQEDLILLDLTEDVEEGTTQSLDRLKKLFGLRALEDY